MRAVELNIVLVDDDGKTYLKTYKTGDPRIGARVLDAIRDVFWEYTHDASASMSSIGPVLRKVTEFRGRVEECDGYPALVRSTDHGRLYLMLEDLLPNEHTDIVDGATRELAYRIDVAAMHVLDPKREVGAG